MTQVDILDHLPDRLLQHPARALDRYLRGPTLIHLPGRRPAPLFVSVLQHGNEPSGWDAVRRLLRGRYQRDPLPRSLALFIGNVAAAGADQRHLDGQSDMNRGWPGTAQHDNQWRGICDQVTGHMQALKPFASIDIHNNTGENPHYAAVNRIDPRALRLASRFSRTVVYFTEPSGVQSAAFGEFCPAVTLECGPPGKRSGTDHAMTYLEAVLAAEELAPEWPQPEDVDLFQVTAVVRVPESVTFSFEPNATHAALGFETGLDRLNFTEVPPGTRLAAVYAQQARLQVCDTDGNDITGLWLSVRDGALTTLRPAMPAMLTTRPEAIRQDCLCYLMERIRIRPSPVAAPEHPELPEHSSRPTSPDAAAR